MKDLFEFFEEQPEKLREITGRYESKFQDTGLDYKDLKEMLEETEAIGYTFEFDLDAEPFNLHQMEESLEYKDAIYSVDEVSYQHEHLSLAKHIIENCLSYDSRCELEKWVLDEIISTEEDINLKGSKIQKRAKKLRAIL